MTKTTMDDVATRGLSRRCGHERLARANPGSPPPPPPPPPPRTNPGAGLSRWAPPGEPPAA